jgi:hypothetical protein
MDDVLKRTNRSKDNGVNYVGPYISEAADSSETVVIFARLHGVRSRQIIIFLATAVSTFNLPFFNCFNAKRRIKCGISKNNNNSLEKTV